MISRALVSLDPEGEGVGCLTSPHRLRALDLDTCGRGVRIRMHLYRGFTLLLSSYFDSYSQSRWNNCFKMFRLLSFRKEEAHVLGATDSLFRLPCVSSASLKMSSRYHFVLWDCKMWE